MYFCPQCGTPRAEETTLCPNCSSTAPVADRVSTGPRVKSDTERTIVGILAGFAVVCIVSGIVLMSAQLQAQRKHGATTVVEYQLPPKQYQFPARNQQPAPPAPRPPQDEVDLPPLMTRSLPTVEELTGNDQLDTLNEPDRRGIYQALALVRLETFEQALDLAAAPLLKLKPGTLFALSGPLLLYQGDKPGRASASRMLGPGEEVTFLEKAEHEGQLWYRLQIRDGTAGWVEMFQLIGHLEGDPQPGMRLLQLGTEARRLELAARASLKLPRELSERDLDRILAEGDAMDWAKAVPENPRTQ